jgi:hypothetical protein
VRALRRVNPIYVVAAVLFVAALTVPVIGPQSDQTGLSRSASVRDDGPAGASLVRRWLDDLGFRTREIEGARFDLGADAGVVFLLGVTEPITPVDVATLRAFVRQGGTVVVATEAGVAETLLLGAYGLGMGAVAREDAAVVGAAGASTGARTLAMDRSRALSLGSRGTALALSGRDPVAGILPDGAGSVILVGSLAPFLSGQLGDADNARFVLALVSGAMRSGKSVAFDEYHHGAHPAPDVLAILERTWPGRTLLVIGALVFAFVVLTGRRLGSAVPVEHRPARSSLDHIRAFAGLVRRSGHGEIARERLRRDLRARLAREAGVDPAAPLDRILSGLAGDRADRAAEVREIDALLARPLRDADLLRTVRRIDELLRGEAS